MTAWSNFWVQTDGSGGLVQYPLNAADIEAEFGVTVQRGENNPANNLFAVQEQAAPDFDENTERRKEGSPVDLGNVWERRWIIADLALATAQERVRKAIVQKRENMLYNPTPITVALSTGEVIPVDLRGAIDERNLDRLEGGQQSVLLLTGTPEPVSFIDAENTIWALNSAQILELTGQVSKKTSAIWEYGTALKEWAVGGYNNQPAIAQSTAELKLLDIETGVVNGSATLTGWPARS